MTVYSVNLGEFFSFLASSGVTACFTIVGGAIVLVFGELATRFFIQPIHSQAELIGEIAHSLTYYANVYGSAELHGEEKAKETSETLRRQASDLRATAGTIRWYGLWNLLGLVPERNAVLEAASLLIGLSNSVHHAGNTTEREERIRDLLNLE